MNLKKEIPPQDASKPVLVFSNVELEILHFIKNGMTSAEMAILRNCSVRTIEKHRSNIIRKLKLKSSQNALLIWIMNIHHILNA